MNHTGAPMDEFFREHAARGAPLVLATIVHTVGSTYRKAGAQMLISADGRAAGLLSGGCLEADLLERARTVLESGAAQRIEYDTRSSDDLIWGLGLGCEGAMSILLSRMGPENDYQPFAFAAACRNEDRGSRFGLVVESRSAQQPLGKAYWPGALNGAPALALRALTTDAPMNKAELVEDSAAALLIAPIARPVRLLVLGAGPDAAPLVEIAGLMNWRIVVIDHRPAYAIAERFPRAQRVAMRPTAEFKAELTDARYDAAVVMSHHLTSDQAYLAALAESAIPYVGLLGPAPRRARLLHELGARADALKARLYGPIGLDIGATTPETIALAIVSEIQAVLAGRPGGSFRDVAVGM